MIKLLQFIFRERVIPYKRMTQKSKWLPRNQAYLAQKGLIGWTIKHAMAAKDLYLGAIIGCPVAVIAEFKVCKKGGSDLEYPI
jgi:hypothetical protein